MLSFVLIVFTFLLYVISSQRALGLSSQSFSQLQLEAQSISMQLTKASSAGNGFTGQIPTYTTPNTKTYNLTITKNGLVILQQKIGSQLITASSFSYVKGIASNPYFLVPGSSTAYAIPISNGTINLQNSFGTICIDYQCPNINNTPSQISLSSQNTYAAQFNGQNSYAYASLGAYFGNNNPLTASAWAYINSSTNGPIFGVADIPPNGGWNMPFLSADGLTVFGWIWGVNTNAPLTISVSPGWHMFSITYNPSGSGTEVFYVDGNVVASGTGQYASSGATDYWTTSISGAKPAGVNAILNGKIANVQAYDSVLSPTQIFDLYQSGISGPPMASANIAGWWPLNGNANDYSGNNNNGNIVGFVPFVSVSEVFAKVLSAAGLPISNLLVGFTSTLGQLSNDGNGVSSFNYTNPNGIATAFLNSNFTNGFANVRATAFNGNLSTQSSLVGWWPMNMGQGNAIPDISHFLASGIATNGVSWNSPNYAATFDGSTSFIATPTANDLNPSSLTLSAWIKPSSFAQCAGPNCIILNKELEYEIAIGTNGLFESAIQPNWAWHSSASTVPLNTWTLVTVTWDGTYENLYINGVLSGSYDLGGGSVISDTNCLYIGARGCPNPASFFPGSISNVQIYNTALSANQIATLYSKGIGGAPVFPNNLVAWWPLNGNANDYSGNGNDGSINGNLKFTELNLPSPTLINQSGVTAASFNGVSSYINVTSSPSLNSQSNYTVSAWYSAPPGSSGLIWSSWNGASTGYQLYLQGGQPAFWAGGTTLIAPNPIATPNNWSNNQWYQIAGVFNPNGEGTLYVNGVQIAQSSIGGTISSGNNQIGVQHTGTALNYFFNGLISNIQVYNSSLSSQQISTIYSGGLQGYPVNTHSLVGWWPLNGNANDYGRNNLGSIPTNVVYVSQSNLAPLTTTALGAYGINLNGMNGAITAPGQNVWDSIAASNQITLAAWVYEKNGTKMYGEIITNGAPTGWNIQLNTAKNGLGATLFAQGGNWLFAPVVQNAWNFLTATGISGKNASIYLNGKLVSSESLVGVVSGPISSNIVWIGAGRNYSTNTFNLNGSIANAQIYNSALNAQQVNQLYDDNLPVTSSINIPVGWYP